LPENATGRGAVQLLLWRGEGDVLLELDKSLGPCSLTNPCIFLMTPIAFHVLLVYSAFYEN